MWGGLWSNGNYCERASICELFKNQEHKRRFFYLGYFPEAITLDRITITWSDLKTTSNPSTTRFVYFRVRKTL